MSDSKDHQKLEEEKSAFLDKEKVLATVQKTEEPEKEKSKPESTVVAPVVPPKQQPSFFKKMWHIPKVVFNKTSLNLSHNSWLKVLSLLLAILFWVFVMDQVNPEVTRTFNNVPVSLINKAELSNNNYVIMSPTEFRVGVEVKGRRNQILGIESENIHLVADLKKVKIGSNYLPVIASVDVQSIEVELTNPSDVPIVIDQIISKLIPVNIKVTGAFEPQYSLLALLPEYEEIKVTGPSTIVNKVHHIHGEMSPSNIKEDVTRKISLTPVDSDDLTVSGVTMEAESANVQMKLGYTKNVPIEVEIVDDTNEKYQLISQEIRPDVVDITGAVADIKEIQMMQADPISITGEESYEIPLVLKIPPNITVVSVSQPVVVAKIEKIIDQEVELMTEDILWRGKKDTFDYQMVEPPIMISAKVTGAEGQIQALDWAPYIDLSFITAPGSYDVPIQADIDLPHTISSTVLIEVTSKDD